MGGCIWEWSFGVAPTLSLSGTPLPYLVSTDPVLSQTGLVDGNYTPVNKNTSGVKNGVAKKCVTSLVDGNYI